LCTIIGAVLGPRHIRAFTHRTVAWTGALPEHQRLVRKASVGFCYRTKYARVLHTRHYIHSVNVPNTIIVNNTYIDNAYRGCYRDFDYRYRAPDAVTVVDREHFVRGQPVAVPRAPDDREPRRWASDARPPAIAPNARALSPDNRHAAELIKSRPVAGRGTS
jgi:hypothetical protein